ncbi:hypothetical protein Cni_G22751 [Canna indica]|uniref:Uncharacterized protein n=1 Tax=Canna indica TaxID=4628 RepID=A0AAQ3QIK3_9LILI|nr:hypothetical protein Cni_G22751 [Canna indica]
MAASPRPPRRATPATSVGWNLWARRPVVLLLLVDPLQKQVLPFEVAEDPTGLTLLPVPSGGSHGPTGLTSQPSLVPPLLGFPSVSSPSTTSPSMPPPPKPSATDRLKLLLIRCSMAADEDTALLPRVVEINYQKPPESYLGKFRRSWALHFGILMCTFVFIVSTTVVVLCL